MNHTFCSCVVLFLELGWLCDLLLISRMQQKWFCMTLGLIYKKPCHFFQVFLECLLWEQPASNKKSAYSETTKCTEFQTSYKLYGKAMWTEERKESGREIPASSPPSSNPSWDSRYLSEGASYIYVHLNITFRWFQPHLSSNCNYVRTQVRVYQLSPVNS